MHNKENRALKVAVFLVLLIIFFSSAVAEQVSFGESFVQDNAGILSPEEKALLSEILRQIYDSGRAEFAVVTINSLDGTPIEDYSYNLVEGRLGKEGADNGLLLLVAVEDRKYRFEVGRGIEDVLNDAKVGRIGRHYLVPNFKSGEYGKGIILASVAIAKELG
ncbi:TPM domain-containing protein, partial [Candidatus Woesearchaeota archaeon]